MKNILLLLFSYFLGFQINAQQFYNLDFEESCDTVLSKICDWEISWATKAVDIKTEYVRGNKVLKIHSPSTKGIAFVEQHQPVNSASYALLTIRAKIKTETIEGRGAGLNISVMDSIGNYLFTNDMGYGSYSWIKGTNDWRHIKLSGILMPNATEVRIGNILYGKGNIWWDDFEIEILDIRDRQPSEFAIAYIGEAIEIIRQNALRRDSIDLTELSGIALQIAGLAETPTDCYLAIQFLLNSLGDHHSFFMKAVEHQSWKEAEVPVDNMNSPIYKIIDSCAYISIPGFHSNNEQLKIDFADTIQKALQLFDDLPLKGWIIDLRQNDGGNMEPMLAGLGPLFDQDTLGYLVDINENKEAWGYRNHAPFSDQEAGVPSSLKVVLENKNKPIAVLMGPATGSSGEIVVLSFIGNSNTKLFGQPTWGLTTGNGEFKLSDGSAMFVSSTVMADRNGKRYYGPIIPDLLIAKENTGQLDSNIDAAIKWIGKMVE